MSLRGSGSLIDDGAFSSEGSLSSCGALYWHGALVARGAFSLFGTLSHSVAFCKDGSLCGTGAMCRYSVHLKALGRFVFSVHLASAGHCPIYRCTRIERGTLLPWYTSQRGGNRPQRFTRCLRGKLGISVHFPIKGALGVHGALRRFGAVEIIGSLRQDGALFVHGTLLSSGATQGFRYTFRVRGTASGRVH